MPRVTLEEQPHYAFGYELTVQPRHENFRRHADHKAFVEMIHDARANVLRSLGLSEKDLGDGRTGDLMGDLVVNYKQEAFAFDRLRIEAHFDLGERSFRMYFRVCRSRGGTVVALAEAGFVTYDYEVGAVVRVPEAFREAVARAAAGARADAAEGRAAG